MDWPVVAGNVFIGSSATTLLLAPICGAATPVKGVATRAIAAMFGLLFALTALLVFSWRGVPGGLGAALSGSIALAVSVAVLLQCGRAIGAFMGDELGAAFTAFLLAIALTVGPFALGPLLSELSPAQSTWLLIANPLVTTAGAAGIDVLHLDVVYQLSPLAHRGVALPVWTASVAGYAVVGLAARGASRFIPWSH